MIQPSVEEFVADEGTAKGAAHRLSESMASNVGYDQRPAACATAPTREAGQRSGALNRRAVVQRQSEGSEVYSCQKAWRKPKSYPLELEPGAVTALFNAIADPPLLRTCAYVVYSAVRLDR
jgi:hypothetical protein